MAGIPGKQIATGSRGIAEANIVDAAVTTAKIAAGALAATAAGRAKIATGFFDSATVTDKFASAAIALDRLAESVIQADGGQAFTADQSMGGFKLTSLGTPTADTDASTKAYVDAVASGLDVKASVRVATTAVLPSNTQAGTGVGATLTATAVGILTVDGVATVLNDRILVKTEAAGDNNGIYKVTTEGTAGVAYVLTRAVDFDQAAEVTAGAFTFVAEGTTNADSGWVLTTNDPITVDTTSLAFSQFSGAGSITAGTGLTKTGSTLDVNAANASIIANADSIEVGFGLVGVISTVNGGDAASAGTELTAARSDHQHAVATATAGTILPDDAAAEGTSTSLARADHKHAIAADTAVAVGTANTEGASTSFARADHVHDAPAGTTSNKNMTASVTAADNASATASTVATTPALDGYVQAFVNGLHVQVGDGTKVSVVSYFSGDAGVTARAIAAIVAGDTYHWNGTIAGYELDANDRIDWDYVV